MKLAITILLIPSLLLASENSCLLKTNKLKKIQVSDVEECRSAAAALLGTEETYFYISDICSPYGGCHDISRELTEVIYTVRYVYREPGKKIKGKVRL